MARPALRYTFEKSLFWALLACCVAVTLFQRAFPSQDGPLHLYYTDVVANLLRGTGAYGSYFQIKHLLPPYAFHTYLLLGLNTIFDPLVSEKVLVSIYIVWFSVAFRYLIHSVAPENHWAPLLAFPFAMNKTLYMGFYNFSFGVATAIFLAGWWVRHATHLTPRRTAVFALLLGLLLLTHPVALLIALMFLIIDTALLTWERRGAAGLGRPILYVVCATATLAWIFMFTRTSKLHGLEFPAKWRFTSFIGMSSLTPLRAFGYRSLLALLALGTASAAALRAIRGGIFRPLTRGLSLAVAGLACVAAYFVVPIKINYGALFPDRFPIFAIAFIAAFAAGLGLAPRIQRVAATAVAVVALVLLGWQAVEKQRILRQLQVVYDSPAPAAGVSAVIISGQPLDAKMFPPDNFMPFYWAGAHYLRRAHATLLNSAWLDAPIQMLKPRSEEKCSYFDPLPMARCLSRASMHNSPEVVIALVGGGNSDWYPPDQLAKAMGLAPLSLPFQSDWMRFYARPAAQQ